VRPQLPELSGHELLAEWRKVIDAATASLNSVGDHVEAPQLVEAMRRQLELVQELVARERRLQQRAANQLLAPIDAVFDLLETSGVTLRKQAEALESAGQALEETAHLVKTQAELFERAIGAVREPSDRARAVAGLKPRARRSATRNNRRRPRTTEK
jgi:hypothetical protein